jgi:hypothetical protein
MDTQQPKSAAQALPEQPQNPPTTPKYDFSRPKRGLYSSMTWAFNHRDDLDRLGNAQEEAMRTWYRENPTAFLDRYTKLAEEHAKRRRSRSQRQKKAEGNPKAPHAPEKAPEGPVSPADDAKDAGDGWVPQAQDRLLAEVYEEMLAKFRALEREIHQDQCPLRTPGCPGWANIENLPPHPATHPAEPSTASANSQSPP